MPESETEANNGTEEDIPEASRPVLPEGYGMPATSEGLLPWSRVTEQLESAKVYWVCTASESGKPHAAPVWGLWLDGVLYFDGHPKTRWGRNLTVNPQISVHLEGGGGDHVVILEGKITPVMSMDREWAERVAGAYDAKYDVTFPGVEDFMTRGLWYFKPSVVLAWDGFPGTLTRWQFG